MRIAYFFLILNMLSPTLVLAQQPLNVVTSIRPIQLITNEIMAGVGQAEVLVSSNQSPHHFQLKPSHLRLTGNADLLIWISDDFETGLKRLHSILPASSHGLELVMQLPQQNLIYDHHTIDGHIWLSPDNIIVISRLIADKLIQLDPAKSSDYLHNTQRLIEKLNHWKKINAQKLLSIKPRYILDHPFLAYFEKSFGLGNTGTLRSSHDRSGSIRQLSELHQALKKNPPKCLLVSQLPLSSQAIQISQQYRLKVLKVDTLGEQSSYSSILNILDNIMTNLESCQ